MSRMLKMRKELPVASLLRSGILLSTGRKVSLEVKLGPGGETGVGGSTLTRLGRRESSCLANPFFCSTENFSHTRAKTISWGVR